MSAWAARALRVSAIKEEEGGVEEEEARGLYSGAMRPGLEVKGACGGFGEEKFVQAEGAIGDVFEQGGRRDE